MIRDYLTRCPGLHESYVLPKLRDNSKLRLSQGVGRHAFMQLSSSLLASPIRCVSETHPRSGATRGCFRSSELERHLGSGKGCQEECLDQVCLWTGLPEGEVLIILSLLSVMLGDGHWMEEAEAGHNAWKTLGKAPLEPGNGYTKGSPSLAATLLDWSGQGSV
jgi:hypothetical protein